MAPPNTVALSLFWTAAVACAVAQAAVLRDVLRRAPRATPGSATATPDASANSRLRTGGRVGEVIWAFVPAIGLTLVLLWTWTAIHDQHPDLKPVGRGTSVQGVSA
jgi:hypothetical protein